MNCMKCSREIDDEQVFCPECLADMEKYPVKPGTVVQLPVRPKPATVRKSSRRRALPSPEEQVRKLKKHIAVLCVLLTLTLAALIAVTGFLLWQMDREDVDVLPGQNYSAEETTDTSEP